MSSESNDRRELKNLLWKIAGAVAGPSLLVAVLDASCHPSPDVNSIRRATQHAEEYAEQLRRRVDRQRAKQKMSPLQQRARAFLQRPVPDGMAYVPDSISERFIATYAEEGRVKLDGELAELLELCVMEAELAADSKSGDEAAFFRESHEVLKGIQEESLR